MIDFIKIARTNVTISVAGRKIQIFLLCHGLPHRCYSISGQKLPICSRCLGTALGLAFLPVAPVLPPSPFVLLLGLLMAIPMIVDGTYQMILRSESTNNVRLLTGFVCSLGLSFILKTAFFHPA